MINQTEMGLNYSYTSLYGTRCVFDDNSLLILNTILDTPTSKKRFCKTKLNTINPKSNSMLRFCKTN